MLKRLIASLFLTVAVTSLTADAANKSTTAVKPPPPDYFPLRVNDWWKYQSTTGEGKQSGFTTKVISAEKQPDETIIYAVDIQSPRVIHDWYSKTRGLVLRHKEQYGDDANMLCVYDPVHQMLKNPLVHDDGWDWRGKGMMGVDIAETSKVSGPEVILVPAGKFSTMKVVTNVNQGGAEVTKTYWYANHIGLVKSATQSGPVASVTELIDYSFKRPSGR